MKVIKNILLVLMFTTSMSAFGQLPDQGEASLLYRKEFVGGVTIHTEGWGLNARFGQQITNLKKFSLGLDIVSIRHPKEKRVFNPAFDNGKGFRYGKANSLIAVRPTIGIRRIWFQKKRPQGVEIGYNFNVGPSLGLVKPTYLEIIYPTGDNYILLEEKFDPNKHTVDNIYGRARFSKGFNEISLYPGAFAKFGLHFEYSNDDEESIQALEIGAMVDYYPKKIPLMVIADNYNFFLNFYVSIIFGKKYF
jgi:hypothetical protein